MFVLCLLCLQNMQKNQVVSNKTWSAQTWDFVCCVCLILWKLFVYCLLLFFLFCLRYACMIHLLNFTQTCSNIFYLKTSLNTQTLMWNILRTELKHLLQLQKIATPKKMWTSQIDHLAPPLNTKQNACFGDTGFDTNFVFWTTLVSSFGRHWFRVSVTLVSCDFWFRRNQFRVLTTPVSCFGDIGLVFRWNNFCVLD